MSKFIYICILFNIIVNITLSAQIKGFCKTPGNFPNALREVEALTLVQPNSYYLVNIYIHVMHMTDGSGGQTPAEVDAAICVLQSDYEPYNIGFVVLGIDHINNTAQYNDDTFTVDGNGDGKFDDFNTNSHSNAIDIYLFANDRLDYGLSAGIPGKALVIGGESFGINLASSHVLSHEVGHCLGLYHTFHGSEFETDGCAEFVDGSNCTTCGDYVCDTPADPWTIFTCIDQPTCTWTGFGIDACCGGDSDDAHGDPYNPNPNLIMSYTTPNCMVDHTPGQVSRMFSTLANSALMQNTLRLVPITGSFVICTINQYSVSLPIGYTNSWSCSSNLRRVFSATSNPNRFEKIGSGSGWGWIRNTISSSCGSVILEKAVWLGTFEGTVVTGQAGVCPNSLYTYTAQVPGGHTSEYSYSWTYPSNWYNNGQIQNMLNLQTPLSPQYGTVRVSITNSCGTSGYSGITVYPGYNCGGYFSIYPNPVSDELNIEILQDSPLGTSLDTDSKTYNVSIFNSQGILIKKVIQRELIFKIPTDGIPDDKYVIEINDGKISDSLHFVVSRN